ncbi:hypothetical protein GYA25_02400 [Candidatus Woesearchaeota archaeon]|nr:hypothetical protein [Candidatus Woesearchaeota archaeon]
MISIALDNSCLNLRKKQEVLNKLDQLYVKNKILLNCSRVNEIEQLKTQKNKDYLNKYISIITEKKNLIESGRLGISKFGDFLFSKKNLNYNLRKIFSKNSDLIDSDYFDIWLLETAILNKQDFFVTLNTNHFIKDGKKESIESLGIKIREPNKDFLKELNGLINNP